MIYTYIYTYDDDLYIYIYHIYICTRVYILIYNQIDIQCFTQLKSPATCVAWPFFVSQPHRIDQELGDRHEFLNQRHLSGPQGVAQVLPGPHDGGIIAVHPGTTQGVLLDVVPWYMFIPRMFPGPCFLPRSSVDLFLMMI